MLTNLLDLLLKISKNVNFLVLIVMLRICYQSSRIFRDASSSDIKKIDFSFTDILVNEVYPFGYECRLNCKSTRTYIIIRSQKPSVIVGYVENIYQNTGKVIKPLNFIFDD